MYNLTPVAFRAHLYSNAIVDSVSINIYCYTFSAGDKIQAQVALERSLEVMRLVLLKQLKLFLNTTQCLVAVLFKNKKQKNPEITLTQPHATSPMSIVPAHSCSCIMLFVL